MWALNGRRCYFTENGYVNVVTGVKVTATLCMASDKITKCFTQSLSDGQADEYYLYKEKWIQSRFLFKKPLKMSASLSFGRQPRMWGTIKTNCETTCGFLDNRERLNIFIVMGLLHAKVLSGQKRSSFASCAGGFLQSYNIKRFGSCFKCSLCTCFFQSDSTCLTSNLTWL